MGVATRCKVSYVVKSANDEQAHCLGVNSLAIDTTENAQVLYSAGRDGAIASWDLGPSFTRDSTKPSRCKAFSQTHTDWVNDIVLCDKGTCIVSASSDRTIKAWRPYDNSSKTAHTIGTHTDYAKCLTYASHPGWVASGGLDRKIKIWNISHLQEVITIDATPLSQHEAIGNNTTYSTTNKSSIYAIATNPSGGLIASGSPEKVIRLWDPKSGKRIGKLTGHTDNIRALLMSEDGKYILSGSSDTTIKMWSVGARRCLATYETHPDSVWSLYSNHPELRTFYSGSRDGLVNKTEITGRSVSVGECVGLFREKSGVVKIAALDDSYIWTATSSSSINCWLSVPPIKDRQVLPYSVFNPDIPASSSTQLISNNDTYSNIRDSYISSDQITIYAGSILSVPTSPQERKMDDQETLLPLRLEPESTIKGKAGIMSHLMLQNRRQVLTKDSDGVVALWDLIKFVQIRSFGKTSLEQAAQHINSLESSPAWCTVDTKIGVITVQLHESSCFDCELYIDETEIDEEYKASTDQRLNLGKWMLARLFEKYIEREVEIQNSGKTRFVEEKTEDVKPQEAENSQQQPGLDHKPSIPALPLLDNLKMPPAAVTSQAEQSPYAPPFAGPFTAPPCLNMQLDYFSGNHRERRESAIQLPPPAVLSTSPTASSFMSRFRNLSMKSKLSRPNNEEPQTIPTLLNTPISISTPPAIREAFPLMDTELSLKETGMYTPATASGELPPLEIPQSTIIMIAEESAEASTGMDLYRGTVMSAGKDADAIVNAAPSWLLSYLLYDKTPTKATVKFTFTLRSADETSLKELPEGPNNRLMANRMLRVGKLLQYISEKLNTEASKLELLCGDILLSHNMTLAAIRQHILKTGGDIPLIYRLK
ncbi:WD40-repeat-containing domain protein [Sporodiniella umbellata]|nr:WD40-repeat-containing domain protein [Sporodiniella umbellata]